jgi:hypothetical protein
VELYLHSTASPSWRGARLKHRDNFTLYLYMAWNEVVLWVFNDVEGNDCDLFEGTVPAFSWKYRGKSRTFSLRVTSNPTEIRIFFSPVQAYIITTE